MESIFYVLTGITALFFVLLILKNLLNWEKFCTLCVAIALTWIGLLTVYFLNIFTDKIIIAILIGHTSLGIFYLWEEKVKEKFKVFRLPVLLSFIFIIYVILESFSFSGLIFIIALWTLFSIVYLFRTQSSVKLFFKKIVECCKKMVKLLKKIKLKGGNKNEKNKFNYICNFVI